MRGWQFFILFYLNAILILHRSLTKRHRSDLLEESNLLSISRHVSAPRVPPVGHFHSQPLLSAGTCFILCTLM